MEFKTYKKRVNLKHCCIAVVCSALILVPITVSTTRAKYQTSESVPLIRGTINYTPYDFKIMAMYQENESGGYDEIDEMPTSGYVINEEKSYCYTTTSSVHDSNAKLYTNSSGEHVVSGIDKNGKCYLWFDEYVWSGIARDMIATKTISTRSSFNEVVTASSTGTMYSAADDDGTSYYFAGAATDNYVYFANKYWRIIRVNGDGTIRMIYDGTTARANGTSSSGTGTSAFNSSYTNNAYVGFMYTLNSVRGLGTSSTIKDALDTWYTSNLKSYASYIDTNAGFCGDRTPYTDKAGTTSGGGTGTTVTYYAGYIRLVTNKTPSLKCTNSSDLYTVNGTSKGNKSLTNPIGLISADEVSYAGGLWYTNNKSYYLYTGSDYWTMSPNNFNGSYAYVFTVYSDGDLGNILVNNTYGVRPVINLRSDVTLTGDGTSSSPYRVS